MLLVCRFTVADQDASAFADRACRALELLLAQPGCLHGVLGRATDEADQWLLSVEFESVTAYRRAMSPFPIREHVIPLLSLAHTDTPGAFEVLADASGPDVRRRTSLVAADASTVNPGEGAGPATPR